MFFVASLTPRWLFYCLPPFPNRTPPIGEFDRLGRLRLEVLGRVLDGSHRRLCALTKPTDTVEPVSVLLVVGCFPLVVCECHAPRLLVLEVLHLYFPLRRDEVVTDTGLTCHGHRIS